MVRHVPHTRGDEPLARRLEVWDEPLINDL